MDFQTVLYQQIQNQQVWTPRQGFLVRRLESGTASDGIAAVLEQAVRAKLGIDPCAEVDWSNIQVPQGKAAIDWTGLLAFIEQLMTVLAPFLSGL
jgi:photosystem II stability/assembly factor-like uncharacterized protein